MSIKGIAIVIIIIVVIGAVAYFIITGFGGTSVSTKDSDGDGIPDTLDDFQFDPAASKDSDHDGHPDEWNAGWNDSTGTTNLTLDALPHDPNDWVDTDGDGFGDNTDMFPLDPEIHTIHYIEEKNYTIAPGAELNTNFQTTNDDKYVVIYWEIGPMTDEAGNTISLRFETNQGWAEDVYHGMTGQEQVPVNQNNSGNWMLRITHDEYRTGYSNPITISYRLYLLK